MSTSTISEPSPENSPAAPIYYQQHRQERQAYNKRWRQQNREKVLAQKGRYQRRHHRARILRKKYGLTEDQYRALLKKQGRACAICGARQNVVAGKERHFVVDHDHVTGIIRGILCNACNLGLSFFADSPSALRRARLYLLKKRA